MDYSEEPDDYVYFGNCLPPLEEDEVAPKKPIRIEDQEVRDEHGRRRFHGAFTGGFSAGYYNTVDTKEGWRPAEFKSSRSERKKMEQKPEDYMDQEDLGSFGIAPQVLRARDDFGENHASKKRTRTVFAPPGAIPGLPILHDLLHPVKETIGITLLRMMGWKHNQGVGERVTRREKRDRRKQEEHFKAYGCQMPPGFRQQGSDGEEESDEESDQLFAPDDVPTYVVQPKTNKFGLGYSGLLSRDTPSSSKRGFVLFEPTLSLMDKKKKLQIAGQAFGVGAFEREDEDIYARDDMSQYDFELGGSKPAKSSTKLLALPSSDLLEGFVRATKNDPVAKIYPLPFIPKGWVPIHRSEHSRFDVKPMTEAEMRGLGRHDLNAFQRSALMQEVLELSTTTASGSCSQTAEVVETVVAAKLTPDEVVAQALAQIRRNVAAQKEKAAAAVSQPAPAASVPKLPPATVVDPHREAKIASLKQFVQSKLTVTAFQPFAKADPAKQFRFDAFTVLTKAGRLEEFDLLQPQGMTEWELTREKEEFERSLHLYRPLTGTMQNRFTSAGHVEENIQGGLVAQIENFLPKDVPQIKKEPYEKDPAKRAAKRKQFGPLTRQRNQWKPDRLLCIRFNVPNPFPDAGAPQNSGKFLAKGAGAKISIFDVLSSGPTSAFVSTGTETVGPVQGPVNQAQELEWEKAEKGELQEKAEPEVVAQEITIKQEEESVAEEETPLERPPIDLFKAIFEDGESDEDDVEEKEAAPAAEKPQIPQPVVQQPVQTAQPTAAVEMDDGAYGPRLPESATVKSTSVDLHHFRRDDDSNDEWVEADKDSKKRHKDKKAKKGKKKKDKKEKKNKKSKKRRHSDTSDSSEQDEDMKILKKIVSLKKQQKLFSQRLRK